jgi:hypothetical protein
MSGIFYANQLIYLSIISAVLILLVGWIVAKLISSGINKFMKKNSLIKEKVTSRFGEDNSDVIVDFISKAVFYVLMVFVLIAAFQVLGLSAVTQPLNSLLGILFSYLPQLLGAAALLLVAWIIATLLKKIILSFFARTKINEKMTEEMDMGGERVKLGATLAELVYWAVFIMFLPAILSALSLNGLLIPIQNMVNTFLSFVPNLFAAAVILVVGWLIAKLCRNIVTNFLKALKIDDFGKKSGLTVEGGAMSLSEIIGMVVYCVILIPVVISALNVLGLQSISAPATNMLNRIIVFLPVLFSAFLIVAFAYFIGRIIGELATGLLSKVGFDRVLPLIGIKESKIDLSQLAGKLITILIVLMAALEASDLLGFAKLSGLMESFVLLAGNVLLGVVIIGIGLYVANMASDLIKKSGVNNSSVLALVARVGILVLVIAMGLSQMGMASDIITLAFMFIGGSLAVSFAIAFGIGGRDLAAKKLAELDEKMKKSD